jgi:TonB-dependent SusC/RagA subfamily outer membrane receptor
MKRLIPSVVFGLALLLLPGLAWAQQGTVTGTVTEAETGNPLPGATVQVQDEGTGAASGSDGQYRIEGVPAGEQTIRVSFVGYQPQERTVNVPAEGTIRANFQLRTSQAELDEVVVTGLGSERSRAQAEVSVGKIDAGELQVANNYSGISELLGAKISGVNLRRTSGNVGGGFRFNVRSGGGIGGGGQPVIYIDGVRVDNEEIDGFGTGGQGISALSQVNPQDIEDIEFLKGPAAAALYGTSGSNGVVLITTRTGEAGTPVSVQYKGVLGVNQQQRDYTYEESGTPDLANSLRRDGGLQEHNVSLSGGTDLVSYYANFTTRTEDGTLRNNSLERNSFQANFDAFPTEDLTLTAKTGYTTSSIARPQNDNNIYGYVGNSTIARVRYAFADSNAVEGAENVLENNSFRGSVQASYTPLEGLELSATAGYQSNEGRNDETFPADLAYPTITNGSRAIFQRRNEQYTYDLSASYDYTLLDGLNATSTVGGQALDRTRRTFFIEKQDFPTSLVSNVGAGSSFQQGDEAFLDTREAGVFGSQQLQYEDTYFLTLGLRRDYSTQVGENAPSIFYPKVSGAVRFDQFDFVPSAFDLLKVRGAYGETGSLPGRLDGLSRLWSAQPSGYGTGAALDAIGNPGIEPETVSEYTVGLDADLYGRSSLSLTYYYSDVEGSIISFQEPPSTGLVASARPFNVGQKTGQGVEVDLSLTPIQRQDVSVTADFIYSYSTNTVDDLGGAQPIFGGFSRNVTKVGLPQNAFFSYTSDVQFLDNSGNQLSGDVNPGDVADYEVVPGKTNENGGPAREFLGTPQPNHRASVSLNVRLLDNLRLYGLVEATHGLKIYDGNRSFTSGLGPGISANKSLNIARYVLSDQTSPFEAFSDEELRDANLPYLTDLEPNSASPGSEEYVRQARVFASNQSTVAGVATDGNFVSKADYLKLREVSVSYNFSDLISRVAPLSSVERVTLGLSARNIFTVTNYTGLDPEVNFNGGEGNIQGQDFLTLPNPQTLTATLNVRF